MEVRQNPAVCIIAIVCILSFAEPPNDLTSRASVVRNAVLYFGGFLRSFTHSVGGRSLSNSSSSLHMEHFRSLIRGLITAGYIGSSKILIIPNSFFSVSILILIEYEKRNTNPDFVWPRARSGTG